MLELLQLQQQLIDRGRFQNEASQRRFAELSRIVAEASGPVGGGGCGRSSFGDGGSGCGAECGVAPSTGFGINACGGGGGGGGGGGVGGGGGETRAPCGGYHGTVGGASGSGMVGGGFGGVDDGYCSFDGGYDGGGGGFSGGGGGGGGCRGVAPSPSAAPLWR